MRFKAILFDVGGPLDLEFAWESAVDGAIAASCGLEGIRVDQTMVEEASDAAVAAFAADTYAHMIETLCGGSRTKYRYKGKCLKMETVDAGTIKGSGRVKYNTTVHGPVTGYPRRHA